MVRTRTSGIEVDVLPPAPLVTLKTALQLYYDFEAGALTVDSTGNGNTLTADFGAATSVSGGKPNNCASFVSANPDSLTAANKVFTNLSNTSFAISGWLNPTTITALTTIVSGEGAGAANGPRVLFDTTTFYFQVFDNAAASQTLSFATPLSAGTWTFFVCNFAIGGNLEVFINGISKGTALQTKFITNDTNAFNLGHLDGNYNGLLDSIGLWKRILTVGEVNKLYNQGSGLSFAQLS